MNEHRPEISIIVPVYNVERFLPECLNSILVQTFTDYELILIDDGSTDSSGRICDKYAGQDAKIVAIHQKNGGISKARNAGLDIARIEKELISFLRPRYLFIMRNKSFSFSRKIAVTALMLNKELYRLCAKVYQRRQEKNIF